VERLALAIAIVERKDSSEPQYEIQSDKTDHIAMHEGSALKLRKPHD
jgi:hypothetical protein